MFDLVLAFVDLVSSSLAEKSKGVLVGLRAFASGDDDADAETAADAPLFGALGIVSRPRDPDAGGHADAIAARTENGLVPVAARDLRLTKARGNVRKGATSLVGYGGAFTGFDDAPSGGGSIATTYVPYGFDGAGTPAHAHSMSMDSTPGAEAVILSHGSGAAVVMTKDGDLVLRNKSGKARIILGADDSITIDAPKVSVLGNTIIGGGPLVNVTIGDATPGAAVPMAPGAGFLGSSPNVKVQKPAP